MRKKDNLTRVIQTSFICLLLISTYANAATLAINNETDFKVVALEVR